jgi:hypothetical protein
MTGPHRDLIRKLEHSEAFPLLALQALQQFRAELDSIEVDAILRARVLGASLGDIADAMGITRQGVAYKLKVAGGNEPDDGPGGDAVDLRVASTEDQLEQR